MFTASACSAPILPGARFDLRSTPAEEGANQLRITTPILNEGELKLVGEARKTVTISTLSPRGASVPFFQQTAALRGAAHLQRRAISLTNSCLLSNLMFRSAPLYEQARPTTKG